MSLRWTPEQLADYLARRGKAGAPERLAPAAEADDGPEWRLQREIETWCRERGLYVFHDRSRSRNAPGHPDLVIALPRARTLWLELKSRRGRLTSDQKRVAQRLRSCGHQWAVIKSFNDFLELVHERAGNEGDGGPR
jgi:hypothetical protein